MVVPSSQVGRPLNHQPNTSFEAVSVNQAVFLNLLACIFQVHFRSGAEWRAHLLLIIEIKAVQGTQRDWV